MPITGAGPGFHRGDGAPTPKGGYYLVYFPENCLIIRKIGLMGVSKIFLARSTTGLQRVQLDRANFLTPKALAAVFKNSATNSQKQFHLRVLRFVHTVAATAMERAKILNFPIAVAVTM